MERKLKIGQTIEFLENKEVETLFGRKISIKAGDEAIITGRKQMRIISGEGRGLIEKVDEKVEGYDHENIVDMIFKRLNTQFNIGNILESEDILIRDFKAEIADLLEEVL